MLFLRAFGIMDLYSALVMILVQFDIIEWRFIVTASAWLMVKAWLFRGDPASLIDFSIGFYHLMMYFIAVPFITYVFVAYLVIKGLMSLI